MRANPCWPKCGGRFRAHKLRGRERLCWRWPSPSSLTQSCLIYRIDVCRLRLRCVEWQRRVARLVTTWAAEGGRGAVAEHGEVLRDATPSRHSDPGTQYTSVFGRRCREMSVRTSMGSVGNAHQNAIAESFFASLEYELLGRHALQKHVRGRTRYALTRRRAGIRHDVVTDRSTISRAGDSNVSPTHCIGPSTHDCMLTRRQAFVDRGEQRDKQQQSESTPL